MGKEVKAKTDQVVDSLLDAFAECECFAATGDNDDDFAGFQDGCDSNLWGRSRKRIRSGGKDIESRRVATHRNARSKQVSAPCPSRHRRSGPVT